MPQVEAAPAAMRVVLAESTRMANQLLSNAFPRDHRFALSGQAVTSAQLLEVIEAGCDVVVLSADLEREQGGLEVARMLRDSRPQLKLVLLLDKLRSEPVVAAFRAGARAVFGRDQALDQLWKCLTCVHAGEIWAGNRELQFLLEALRHSIPPRITNAEGVSLLSEQEEKIVFHICLGLTNREIAERMALSEHTVKNHLFRIYSRLGISSRTELMFSVLTQHVVHAPRLAEPSPSDAETFQTYLKHADHSPETQFAIGNMYLEGCGTCKDLPAGYMWLVLAEHTVRQLLHSCTALKNHVAAQITAKEKLAAESRAASRMASANPHAASRDEFTAPHAVAHSNHRRGELPPAARHRRAALVA